MNTTPNNSSHFESFESESNPEVTWQTSPITARHVCERIIFRLSAVYTESNCCAEWANKKRAEQDVSLQGTDTWPWFLKPVDSEALLKFLKLVSSCLSNCKFAATTILEEEEEILSFFLVLWPNTYCMWTLWTLWTLYGHRDASIFALQSSRTSIPRKHVVN